MNEMKGEMNEKPGETGEANEEVIEVDGEMNDELEQIKDVEILVHTARYAHKVFNALETSKAQIRAIIKHMEKAGVKRDF